MTNYEKYMDDVIDIIEKRKSPAVKDGVLTNCSKIRCHECDLFVEEEPRDVPYTMKCNARFSEWLRKEYKPFKEPNWSKVAVDTPVQVKDHCYDTWFNRYFAGYDDGRVITWCDGGTSWSCENREDKLESWDMGKLAEIKKE